MALTLDQLYGTLQTFICDAEFRYIEPHINQFEGPDEYELDVRSYCILCHAAFEEFVESISIYLLNEAESKLKETHRISWSLLSLMHFKGSPNKLGEKEWSDSTLLLSYFIDQISEIKTTFSNYIMANNHGVSLKYMRKLLLPVGLDLPQDVNEQNALKQLSFVRGSYAHSFSTARINIVLSPEDALNYVKDVNEMMNKIKRQAQKIPFYLYNMN